MLSVKLAWAETLVKETGFGFAHSSSSNNAAIV
jgi:hypothetical protein